MARERRTRTTIRPRPEGTSIVAAATAVDLTSRGAARRDLGKRQGWQEEAWAYFDAVPEVKHAVWLMGNAMGKLRLFVAVDNPTDPKGAPIPASSPDSGVDQALAGLADAELARLTGAIGGQAEILREASMNLDVAGEGYLVGWGAREPVTDEVTGKTTPGTPERWEVRSISEVTVVGDHTVVKDSPDDKGAPLDPTRDTIVRFWQRHPRWSALADSHMAGVLGECEALVALHHEMLADSRSRHNLGLLTVPNELSAGPPHPENATGPDEDDDDPLSADLMDTFAEPIDSDAPGGWSPSILRGPGKHLGPDQLRFVEMGRKPSAELDAKIDKRVARLARGLNMPVETSLGHQGTTFANAGQVDEDLFSDYMEPRAVTLVDGLTMGFLHPQLLDTGDDTEPNEVLAGEVRRMFVWYDPSALVAPPDLSEAADDALEHDAISLRAYRAAKGFSEDDRPGAAEDDDTASATSDDDTALSIAQVERLARISQQLYLAVGVIYTADEVRAMLNDAGAGLTGPAPEPEPSTGGNNDVDGDAAAVTAAAGPAAPGARLVAIDTELRARLLVLADAHMTRAMERAGNRLRSNATLRHQVGQHLRPSLMAATLGAPVVAAAGFTDDALIGDAFAPMREQFMAWGAGAQAEAIDVVGSIVGGFSDADRHALGLRQADSLDEAWRWLEETLTSLAAARLYDPSAYLETAGEVAQALAVPPGIIRHAMAMAGGAAGIETAGTDAWVTITEGGTRPAGGIGYGDLVRDLLRDAGVTTEAYRWVYGPAARRRPFEPHQALSGVVFDSFDADVLANTSGWPAFSHYMPGDHRGCLCDVEPVLVAADGTVSEDW